MNFNSNHMSKLIEDQSLRNQTFIFQNRYEAGKLLANKLNINRVDNLVVLAIPAGGVPVGVAIAEYYKSVFHLIITRKLQIPGNPEAGYGAIAPNGSTVLNESLIQQLKLTDDEINIQVSSALEDIESRYKKYLINIPFPEINNKVIVLTDDGLASGFTMLAAIRAIKDNFPQKIIIAVPTAPMSTINRLLPEVDQLFCLNVRDTQRFAVADAYTNWYDLNDSEVEVYLKKIYPFL